MFAIEFTVEAAQDIRLLRKVVAIGFKRGSTLFVHGEEYEL